MTLEEWIGDVKSMVEENKILIEHTVDPFEKRFRQKQLEISSEKLELLEELQRYRKVVTASGMEENGQNNNSISS